VLVKSRIFFKKRYTRSFENGCCPGQPLLEGVGVQRGAAVGKYKTDRGEKECNVRATENASGEVGWNPAPTKEVKIAYTFCERTQKLSGWKA
jgi:hypothetical protein